MDAHAVCAAQRFIDDGVFRLTDEAQRCQELLQMRTSLMMVHLVVAKLRSQPKTCPRPSGDNLGLIIEGRVAVFFDLDLLGFLTQFTDPLTPIAPGIKIRHRLIADNFGLGG